MSRKPLLKWALHQLEEMTKKGKNTATCQIHNYHFVPVGIETKGANSATLCQVLKLPALVETYGA